MRTTLLTLVALVGAWHGATARRHSPPSGVVDCEPRGWREHAPPATQGCCAYEKGKSFTAYQDSYSITDNSGAMDSRAVANRTWTISASGDIKLEKIEIVQNFAGRFMEREKRYFLGGERA